MHLSDILSKNMQHVDQSHTILKQLRIYQPETLFWNNFPGRFSWTFFLDVFPGRFSWTFFQVGNDPENTPHIEVGRLISFLSDLR